jgi:hypothetical protein
MPEVRFAELRPAAEAIAAVLAGSWRSPPPPLVVSAEDLHEALPLLAQTNAAALAWWRLRDTVFASLAGVDALHDAYRYAVLRAQLQESRLISVFETLRSVSVEPILLKGWDIARLYPQGALRPYEDIDLIVRPDELELAQATLRSDERTGAIVDFSHAEISVFDSGDWSGLYDRSRVVGFAGSEVRVLSPEDHLRAICLHGLKHCFSNPLWLADIAVCVEAATREFDWTRCFGQRQPQNQWIGCAIGLAREMLGCDVTAEVAERLEPLPRWLVPVVLETWIRWATAGPDERWALGELFDRPADALSVVARRWPNQLVVALKRRARLSDDPPWLQRLYALAYLFEPKRVVEALLRNGPQRSTP